MPITSLDTLIASIKRNVMYWKSASRTSVAFVPFSIFDQAGDPGAGTMAVGNTANGIVPTDALAGYPILATAAGSLYLNRIRYSNSVLSWLDIYDCVFSCGAYAFNADTTLASQPSYASRLPNTDYNGLQIWLECVTAFTGLQTVQINYLDQGGAAGDSGAIVTTITPIVGRMYQIPLASGDGGVQQITRVRSSIATVGTFNVHVMRWLWGARVSVAQTGNVDSLLKTGLKQIYDTSALRFVITADSTATGTPTFKMETADG